MSRSLLILLACTAVALAFAACGGGAENDEEQITVAIEASTTTTDPADCEKYATLAFMEQSESKRGEAAVASCEANIGDTTSDPDSISVSKVKVNGEAATAEVAFAGGDLDKQTLIIALVNVAGNWKLDRIERFAVLDRDAIVRNFEGHFGPDDLTADELNCVREALELASAEQLEALFLDNDSKTVVELVGDCGGGGQGAANQRSS